MTEFEQYGFAHFRNSWVQWDAFNGQSICISGIGKEPIVGISAGVNDAGALILNQDNKSITIHAGDLSLRVKS